jgi:UDP-N-acetylglucosamine 3-dehydrogenase
MSQSRKRKFRAAVVGLGKMGRNHLRVLLAHGGYEIKALVDPRAETQDILPAGAKWYGDVAQLVSSEKDLELVVCASSTKSHFEIASELLKLKVPVLMEKPLARGFQESQRLAGLAAEAKVPVFVGHTERCNPAVRKLREVIESGIIGTPIHYSTTLVGGFPQERLDTNVLLDLAVHDLDVLCLLAGPLKLRSSICHNTLDKSSYDTAQLLLSNDKGSSASVHVNWITPTKIRTLRVTGSKGVARVDYILQTCRVVGGEMIKKGPRQEFNFTDVINDYMNTDQIEFGVAKREPLLVQADEMYNYLSIGRCNLATAEEGAKIVNLAEMAIAMGQGGISAV